MPNSNASIFQACSNVQVNGGNFNVSGRDINTQTVHHHFGSVSHQFGYASNVNTGSNYGHFSQGGQQGYPRQPPPPPPQGYSPYMGGAYGYGAMPGYYPHGGYNNGSPHRSQTYPQPARSPPASEGPTPHGMGASPTNPSTTHFGSSNPYRTTPRADTDPQFPPPPPPRRSSSNCAQTDDDVDDVDDIEVEEIESPGVAEKPAGPQGQGSSSWASMHAAWGQRTPT